MPNAYDRAERLHFESAEEWRAWLRANHRQTDGVWFVSWRRHTGKPAVSYEDAVCEALCWGWIDSVVRTLDDDRRMLWMAPRRAGSVWSKPNKERVERLERQRRMTAAGRRAVETARANGMWTALDDADNEVIPDDLAAAFARHEGSAENFAAFPGSVRRGVLGWIGLAKRPETRAKRIEETATRAARNERPGQWAT